MITQIDTDEVFLNGQVIASKTTVRDITAPSIEYALHAKARQALANNAAFLALASPTNAQTLAQVRRLTRETNAIIRLLIGSDLLVENADT